MAAQPGAAPPAPASVAASSGSVAGAFGSPRGGGQPAEAAVTGLQAARREVAHESLDVLGSRLCVEMGRAPVSPTEAEQQLAAKRQRMDRLVQNLPDGGASHWKVVARYERYIALLQQRQEQAQQGSKRPAERGGQQLGPGGSQQQGQTAKRHKRLERPLLLATKCKVCFKSPASGKQLKHAKVRGQRFGVHWCLWRARREHCVLSAPLYLLMHPWL